MTKGICGNPGYHRRWRPGCAGKTTLLNTLLGGDRSLHLAILMNDFGSIN